jgi:hypothetical protein
MSDLDEKDVVEVSNQDSCEPERQSREFGLASENSSEETIRRMKAFPERANKLRKLIRAIREQGLD